jgi:hypothetical protein
MKRLACVLLTFLLLGLTGCGGDKDRGINKDKDKPRPGSTQK